MLKPYSLSQLELLSDYSPQELNECLEKFLVFGSYSEVLELATPDEKISYLTEKVSSRLLKDNLILKSVRAPGVLFNLLQLLAFHIGREISVGELASQLGVDGKTISRYLDLLEKSSIILRLDGFSRELPGEISRKSRYYFMDNGIRNGLLSQFNGLGLRNDTEKLWENFMVVERFKKQTYYQVPVRSYFWRTYSGQHLELVEERGEILHGYGFKLSHHKTPRTPKLWFKAYPSAHYHVINLNNYLEFIT